MPAGCRNPLDPPLPLPIPGGWVERIAERAAEIVLDRLDVEKNWASPFLTVPEAAVYLCCRPQRVYDLLSSGRLTRRKDGRRVLVSRDEVDSYLGNGLKPVAPALPPGPQDRIGSGFTG